MASFPTHTDAQTHRHTGTQTRRHADTQTNNHPPTHTHTHTHTSLESCLKSLSRAQNPLFFGSTNMARTACTCLHILPTKPGSCTAHGTGRHGLSCEVSYASCFNLFTNMVFPERNSRSNNSSQRGKQLGVPPKSSACFMETSFWRPGNTFFGPCLVPLRYKKLSRRGCSLSKDWSDSMSRCRKKCSTCSSLRLGLQVEVSGLGAASCQNKNRFAPMLYHQPKQRKACQQALFQLLLWVAGLTWNSCSLLSKMFLDPVRFARWEGNLVRGW